MSEDNKQDTSESDKESENDSPEAVGYENREEYIVALQNWVHQARMWQNVSACFPYYLMANQEFQSHANVNPLTTTANREPTYEQPIRNEQPARPRRPRLLNPTEGFEFVIPPVWKRILAEGVDFLILFIVKLALTLVALELMDPSEWDFLKENMTTNFAEMSLGTELTTGILVLEGIHRVMVCAYEIYWLHGTNDMRFGCATPGKALFGITVVFATKIQQLDPANPASQRVLVYPGRDLGLWVAVSRSFVKNIVLAVMFPFCFALFLFQHNRTGYDIMCNTLVVEYDPNPPKRNWP